MISILAILGVIFSLISYGNLNMLPSNDFRWAGKSAMGENLNSAVGDWLPQIVRTVGAYPSDIVIGDANNDGFDDILTADTNDRTVSILLGSPANDWSQKHVLGPFPTYVHRVCVGDANNDGLNDIIVGYAAANFISIFLGIPYGISGEQRINAPQQGTSGVYIGDATNDGLNDIVVTVSASSRIAIFQWQQSNWIMMHYMDIGHQANQLIVADVNNDGFNDILTIDNYAGSIVLLPATGSHQWAQYQMRSAPPPIYHMAVGDANNDGYNDLVLGHYQHSQIDILTGALNLWWTNHFILTGMADTSCVFVEDADNDGFNDIIAADLFQHKVLIFTWNTQGNNWNGPIIKSVGLCPASIDVDDVNYDGFNDIVTANNEAFTVSILLWDEYPVASFTANPLIINEGEIVDFTFTGSEGNGPSSYSWWFGDGETSTDVNPNHLYNNNGTYQVNLTVIDDDGDSDTQTLYLTVNNIAPLVDIGPDLIVDEGEPIYFYPTVIDPGTDTLIYRWDFENDGIIDTMMHYPFHSYGDNGIYIVNLTVDDCDGGITCDTITVTVNNVAPIVYAGPDMNAMEGEIINFLGEFADSGQLDTHTISWDFGDSGSTSGTLTPTHVYQDDGLYVVTLTVADDDGGISMDDLFMTIHNSPPVVDIGPDHTIDEGDSITFSAVITDPGSDTFTYEWDFNSDSVIDSTVENPTHIFSDNGVYIVTLTVTDDDGGKGNRSSIVTVNNVAPTVDIGPDQTINEGESISFSAIITDPGSDTFTYAWDFNNDGMIDSTISNPTNTFLTPGTYLVTLNVSDDDGGMGTDTCLITVLEIVVGEEYEGCGWLQIDDECYHGSGVMRVSENSLILEIEGLSRSWDITCHFECGLLEFYCGESEQGFIKIMILHGKDTSYLLAIGEGAFFKGLT